MGRVITAVVVESNDPVFINYAKLDESITEVKWSIILSEDEYKEIK